MGSNHAGFNVNNVKFTFLLQFNAINYAVGVNGGLPTFFEANKLPLRTNREEVVDGIKGACLPCGEQAYPRRSLGTRNGGWILRLRTLPRTYRVTESVAQDADVVMDSCLHFHGDEQR